jgi:hypothetical protein
MTTPHMPKAIAALAAAITTLVVFSSVASLADEDKAALAFGKSKPTTLAQNVERVQH